MLSIPQYYSKVIWELLCYFKPHERQPLSMSCLSTWNNVSPDRHLWNFVFGIFTKTGQNNRHFTWRPTSIYV